MNKINKRGMELIQYKEELGKEYPKLVKDSLIVALEKMIENRNLDDDTFVLVKDEQYEMELFKVYLLAKKDFSKTEKELFEEFEAVRSDMNLSLLQIGGFEDVKSVSDVNNDVISILKTFCIDEAFTIEYFGADEKTAVELMKRKGFMEKFSAFRLPKILSDFMEKLEYSDTLFKCEYNPGIFFENESNGYCIEFIIKINIEKFDQIDTINIIYSEIKDIKTKLDEFYNLRMVI